MKQITERQKTAVQKAGFSKGCRVRVLKGHNFPKFQEGEDGDLMDIDEERRNGRVLFANRKEPVLVALKHLRVLTVDDYLPNRTRQNRRRDSEESEAMWLTRHLQDDGLPSLADRLAARRGVAVSSSVPSHTSSFAMSQRLMTMEDRALEIAEQRDALGTELWNYKNSVREAECLAQQREVVTEYLEDVAGARELELVELRAEVQDQDALVNENERLREQLEELQGACAATLEVAERLKLKEEALCLVLAKNNANFEEDLARASEEISEEQAIRRSLQGSEMAAIQSTSDLDILKAKVNSGIEEQSHRCKKLEEQELVAEEELRSLRLLSQELEKAEASSEVSELQGQLDQLEREARAKESLHRSLHLEAAAASATSSLAARRSSVASLETIPLTLSVESLFNAAGNNDTETLAEVLHGSNLEAALRARDSSGKSLLHAAVASGAEGTTRQILKAQAKVRERRRHLNTLQGELLMADLDHLVNSEDAEKRCPLLILAGGKADVPDLVRSLLDARVDPDVRGGRLGRSAFLEAAEAGNVATCRLMLSATRGKALYDLDNEKSTSLHLGATQGHCKILKLLLHTRAEVHCLNDRGETPVDLAKRIGHKEAAKLLEDPDSAAAEYAIENATLLEEAKAAERTEHEEREAAADAAVAAKPGRASSASMREKLSKDVENPTKATVTQPLRPSQGGQKSASNADSKDSKDSKDEDSKDGKDRKDSKASKDNKDGKEDTSKDGPSQEKNTGSSASSPGDNDEKGDTNDASKSEKEGSAASATGEVQKEKKVNDGGADHEKNTERGLEAGTAVAKPASSTVAATSNSDAATPANAGQETGTLPSDAAGSTGADVAASTRHVTKKDSSEASTDHSANTDQAARPATSAASDDTSKSAVKQSAQEPGEATLIEAGQKEPATQPIKAAEEEKQEPAKEASEKEAAKKAETESGQETSQEVGEEATKKETGKETATESGPETRKEEIGAEPATATTVQPPDTTAK